MSVKVKYSVVVPVFNSEKSLPELQERLVKVFDDLKESFEIVLVDDSSRDDSWKVMLELHKKDKRVKIIQLMKNFGQHSALMCGFRYASGEYVITMDDDLQHPPEEIPKLINKIKEGYDVVYGQYIEKKHLWFRNLGSNLVNWILAKISNINCKMTTSFKIVNKDVLDKVIKFKNFSPMIDVFISNITKKIGVCYVAHEQRKYGKTNYSIKGLVFFALNTLFNFTTLPLRVVTYMGLFFSVLSVGLAVFFLIRYFQNQIIVSGFTTLIVSLMFFSGLILFVLGIIGEYIGRIFLNITNKPQYEVRKIEI